MAETAPLFIRVLVVETKHSRWARAFRTSEALDGALAEYVHDNWARDIDPPPENPTEMIAEYLEGMNGDFTYDTYCLEVEH